MKDDAQIIIARRQLAVQYAARRPPRHPSFQWPSPPSLLLAIQPYLESDLFLPDNGISTAPAEYQRIFLKALIDRLSVAVAEHDGDDDGEFEVDERLLERYTTLLTSSSPSSASQGLTAGPPPPSTIQYFYPRRPTIESEPQHELHGGSPLPLLLTDLNSILLHEAGAMISRGTTGLRTWEASLTLASYLLGSATSNPAHRETSLWHTIVRPGARVLELGSGVGMLGVLCAQLQEDYHTRQQKRGNQGSEGKGGGGGVVATPAEVYMTDVPGQVLEALSETVEQNNLASSAHVHIAPLDWVELSSQHGTAGKEETDSGRLLEDTSAGTRTWLHSLAPTTVLAADVVFDPSLCGPLADTIRCALEAGISQREQADRVGDGDGSKALEPTAYVASTIRNPATYDVFLQALRKQHLHFDRIKLNAGRTSIPLLPFNPSTSHPTLPAAMPVPVFPSSHDPLRDGVVELLQIRLLPQRTIAME
ncbi:unnamed protein product [Tilletia controversa]|uniref:Uncharacterized protein n=1 Tax=Tilletia controversa TaxID=13291 RepID=A0A8X7MTK6_9BASI|nr:hypothetical protein CF328_g5282 [Tilletia controversa]KAE8247308.1 hypothetical protein A4X06_0g4548 [Tilletia controversa]CAD6899991.1 unnamed protein product [Tilletia controversa]CAD6952559.1 unnamed protein product [Tilletia controversa]CAD6957706.1 unnamed protein product [Tilletia controversa]